MIHGEIVLTLLDVLTIFVYLKIDYFTLSKLLSIVLGRESILEICFTIQEGWIDSQKYLLVSVVWRENLTTSLDEKLVKICI